MYVREGKQTHLAEITNFHWNSKTSTCRRNQDKHAIFVTTQTRTPTNHLGLLSSKFPMNDCQHCFPPSPKPDYSLEHWTSSPEVTQNTPNVLYHQCDPRPTTSKKMRSINKQELHWTNFLMMSRKYLLVEILALVISLAEFLVQCRELFFPRKPPIVFLIIGFISDTIIYM